MCRVEDPCVPRRKVKATRRNDRAFDQSIDVHVHCANVGRGRPLKPSQWGADIVQPPHPSVCCARNSINIFVVRARSNHHHPNRNTVPKVKATVKRMRNMC